MYQNVPVDVGVQVTVPELAPLFITPTTPNPVPVAGVVLIQKG